MDKHIWFIHLLVAGLLGCFQSLVVMNNAVWNTYVQISLHFFTSLGFIPEGGIAGLCFPKQLYHFIFPPALYEGSNLASCSH